MRVTRIICFIASCFAFLALAGTAEISQARPGPSKPHGQIVINRSGCGAFHCGIWMMDGDGSNLRRLSHDGFSPAWSPDGTQIAFEYGLNRQSNFDVYVMDVDGSGLRRLTDDSARDFEPAWSPDGTQIAFASDRSGNVDVYVYVMDVDGSGLRRLTTDPGFDVEPAWSPDGTQIAFSSDRSGSFDVYSMNADGSSQKDLTLTSQLVEARPAWSPSGHLIALAGQIAQGGTFEILTIRPDGADLKNRTNSPANEIDPAWSSNGNRIAFSRYGDDLHGEIFVKVLSSNSPPDQLTVDAHLSSWESDWTG